MMGIELIQNDWNWVDAKLFDKQFGTFLIFWNFPIILELSKYFGTFQIFWNFPNNLKLSKYFGRFQVFWNFHMLAWVWNVMNEDWMMWMMMKSYERVWNIMNDYDEIALKIFIFQKIWNQPFSRIWKKLQNMMKIELFLWLRDEMISSSKRIITYLSTQFMLDYVLTAVLDIYIEILKLNIQRKRYFHNIWTLDVSCAI